MQQAAYRSSCLISGRIAIDRASTADETIQAVEIIPATLMRITLKALALAEEEIDVRRPLHTLPTAWTRACVRAADLVREGNRPGRRGRILFTDNYSRTPLFSKPISQTNPQPPTDIAQIPNYAPTQLAPPTAIERINSQPEPHPLLLSSPSFPPSFSTSTSPTHPTLPISPLHRSHLPISIQKPHPSRRYLTPFLFPSISPASTKISNLESRTRVAFVLGFFSIGGLDSGMVWFCCGGG